MSAWGDRLTKLAEDRFGLSLVPQDELQEMRDVTFKFEQFREEASELAYQAVDYFNGRSPQMRPEKRNRLARRSRDALTQDPMAGAEADLLTNFSFGKGVSQPDAEDETVQDIIEEAWTDPVNRQKLTSFEAQRHRSYELLTQANLYPAAFIRNGRVRLAFLDADRVREVICDEDDDERPLWYVYEEPPKPTWNFEQDRWNIFGEGGATEQRGRIVYYPHWRNVEDVNRERAENHLGPIDMPPADRLGKALVEHVRINRIGRTQFGTPPWARTLRFYSAMNQLTNAHVAMAEAASSIIAKRVMAGSPETITKSANAILAMTGEIGASRFGQGQPPEDLIRDGKVPDPGSFWVENEAHRLESMSLNSGAGQALQTAQIVRAPIAAASGFGQHYLGDSSTANLSTATSLELPTTFTVQSWQETFRSGLFTWFIDIVLEAALRAGRLGGEKADPRLDKTIAELHVAEALERKEAESRTGLKLGYTFSMPYPGRRNLPDVASMVTTVAAGFDAGAMNVPLRRALLLELAKHGLQVENPSGWVDDVLPEETGDAIVRQQIAQQIAALQPVDPATGAPPPAGGYVPPGQGDPTVGPSGERPANARGSFEELEEELSRLFDEQVITPLLAGSQNGAG